MSASGNGRIQVQPGLGREGERGVVWTVWGCHGNPAAKTRQGQCGREAACSVREGMPPGGLFANYTNIIRTEVQAELIFK